MIHMQIQYIAYGLYADFVQSKKSWKMIWTCKNFVVQSKKSLIAI